MGRQNIGWVLFGSLIACAACVGAAHAQVTEVTALFHCSGDTCFFDAERCERYVQDARDLGRRAARCRESAQVACFEWYDVYEESDYSRCFPAPAMCGRELRRFRQRNYWSNAHDSPRYSGISECQTLRYSRRRAEQLARAEQELEEARARVDEQRAAYAALAARRDSDLVGIVLGGAVLSRTVHCAASGECDFTPAEGHAPVEEAHCMVGVDPDGRLGFVCFAERALCTERRAALVAAQRERAIPLRIAGDCFAAYQGESGTSYFVIDEEGREVDAASTDAEPSESAIDLDQAI